MCVLLELTSFFFGLVIAKIRLEFEDLRLCILGANER